MIDKHYAQRLFKPEKEAMLLHELAVDHKYDVVFFIPWQCAIDRVGARHPVSVNIVHEIPLHVVYPANFFAKIWAAVPEMGSGRAAVWGGQTVAQVVSNVMCTHRRPAAK